MSSQFVIPLATFLRPCCAAVAEILASMQEQSRVPDVLLTVAEVTVQETTTLSNYLIQSLKACDERADHVRHFEVGRTSQ